VYAAELVGAEEEKAVSAAMRNYVELLLTLADESIKNVASHAEMARRPIVRSGVLERAEIERLAGNGYTWALTEMVNIDRAVTHCLREGWAELAADLVDRAFVVLDVHFSYGRAVQIREQLRDAAFAGGHELVAWRSHYDLQFQRLMSLGVSEELLAEFSRCADAFEALGAQSELAATLAALAYNAWVHTGEPQISLAERSVAAARACGDQGAYINALCELGTMFATTGRYAESVRALDEALTISREFGDQHGTALVLNRVASNALHNNDLERASEASREALDLAVALGMPRGIAYCKLKVAQVDLALDNAEAARDAAKAAVADFEAYGEPRGILRSLAVVAEASLALGLPDDAVETATTALEKYSDTGDALTEERLRVVLATAGQHT
jgi:tetratricopeptide (TPR) repeat protein